MSAAWQEASEIKRRTGIAYIWRVGLHPDRGTGVTVPSRALVFEKTPLALFPVSRAVNGPLFLLASLLFCLPVQAVSERAAPSEAIVLEKTAWEERRATPSESLAGETARRAEAAKKAEMLRQIPPEKVQDWISGKLSQAELAALVASAPGAAARASAASVPVTHVSRLLLVSLGALLLSLVYVVQRRRSEARAAKAQKQARADINAPGKTWHVG